MPVPGHRSRRLLAVLAHPDDESLGMGGTLAKYASEGVETFLLTATRGEGGRYRGHPVGSPEHPGAEALGRIREAELRAAASALGVREVALLGYPRHGSSIAPAPQRRSRRIVAHLRRVRPDVVVTFGPDGAYGHPDHIAISQLTTAAVVAAADPAFALPATPPRRRIPCRSSITWPGRKRRGRPIRAALKKLMSTVDGVERQAVPWPDWAITTVDRHASASGRRCGERCRVTSRRLRPTSA